MICYASRIAPRVRAWLDRFATNQPPGVSSSPGGFILHLFPHACNLVNEQGAVLSLVTSDIGPNPLAIVLPPLHFPDFITMDSTPSLALPLSGGGNLALVRVVVGKLTIDLTTAVLWQPVPAWHNRLDLELIHTIVTNHPDFQPAVPLGLANQMQQALHNHDEALIAQTARQLAGLGPGLTPAGDDFLVGVLYSVFSNQYSVFSIQSEPPLITDYCSLITSSSTPHTTTLSANLLEAAGRGEASEAWHELLRAQEKMTVYSAISHILYTGHSSGSDALLGFLMGIMLR